MKNNNTSRLTNLVVPLVFSAIGILTSYLFKIEITEGIILSLLLGIMSNQIQQNFVSFQNNERAEETYNTLVEKISEVAHISKLREKIKEINHLYFDKLERSLYDSFISEYERLAQGEFSSKLNTENAFLPKDMKYISNGAYLKMSCTIWNFSINIYKNEEYTLLLKDMINKRKITIKRIFIFSSKDEKEKYNDEMERQNKIGIQVYYVYADDKFFGNEEWLYEDFIIEDDRILIQQFAYAKEDGFSISPFSRDSQLITTDLAKVSEKVKHFSLLEERAIQYAPKQLSQLI